MKAALSLQF